MHVSVRHDLFYNFSSGVMNVKNKEKNPVFCSPLSKGFYATPSDALWFTSQVLRQMKDLIELINSWRRQFWI